MEFICCKDDAAKEIKAKTLAELNMVKTGRRCDADKMVE